jgi:hypothetical protein
MAVLLWCASMIAILGARPGHDCEDGPTRLAPHARRACRHARLDRAAPRVAGLARRAHRAECSGGIAAAVDGVNLVGA